MTTQVEDAQGRYSVLKPAAVAAAHDYVMTRTPPELQDEMAVIIDADLNPPPDPTHAVVANGASVPVRNWDASSGPGVATVAGGTLTQVTATPVATKTIVNHNAAIAVHNLADANLAGSPGNATVAAGALTKVNLTV